MQKPTIEELKEENLRLKTELEALKSTVKSTENISKLAYGLGLEEIVSDISTRFINTEYGKLDSAIDLALKDLGQYVAVDRTYLFLYNHSKIEMTCTNEWCNTGISSEIDMLQNLPVNIFPWWNNTLLDSRLIKLDNLADLPEAAAAEKEILEAQNIKSLLVVPIIYTDNVHGFIGFDSVLEHKKWTKEEVRLLQLVADILAGVFTNNNTNQKLHDSEELYRSLVESIDALVLVIDKAGKTKYTNSKVPQQYGISCNDIINRSIFDFFEPPIATQFVKEIEQVINDQQPLNSRRQINVLDGKKWFTHKLYPIFQNKKITDRVLVIIDDIDKQVKDSLQLQRINKRLIGLHDIDKALIRQFDTEENIFKQALEYLYTMVPATVATFGKLNPELQKFVVEGAYLKNGEDISIELKEDLKTFGFSDFADDTITRIMNNQPFVKKYQENNLTSNFQKFVFSRGLHASFHVPIFIDEKVIGILILLSDDNEFFIDEYIDIIEEVARQMEIGLKMGYLYTEVQNYNEHLEELVEKRTQEKDELSDLTNIIVNSTSAAIFSIQPNGIIESINPMAEKLLGYKANELIGTKALVSLFAESELQHIYDEANKPVGAEFETEEEALFFWLKSKHNETFESIVKDKSGKEISVLFTFSTVWDSQKEIKRFVGVAIDITHQKIADQAMRLQSAAFESFADALVITDPDGKIVWANCSFETLSGYSQDEYLGQSVGRILRSDVNAPDRYKQLWETVLAGKVWSGVIHNQRKDGTMYPEDLTVTPLVESNGEINNFISIKRDISDQIEAENALRATLLQIETLVNNLQDGIVFEDASRRIVLVNSAFCDILGYNDRSTDFFTIDQDVSFGIIQDALLNPDDFLKRIDEIYEGNRPVTGNVLYLKNGRILQQDYVPVEISGKSYGHLWQLFDITEIKQKEAYAKVLQKLGFSLAITTEIDEALQQSVEVMKTITEIDMMGIMLFNTESGELQHLDHFGCDKEIIAVFESFALDHEEARLIKSGEIIFDSTKNVYGDTEFYPICEKNQLQSVAVIPVRHDNSSIGVIKAGFKKEHVLTSSMQHLLLTFAEQIGRALVRIKSSTAVLQSQTNFRLMFEAIDDYMFIFNEEGYILKTNPIVEKNLGYDKEELIGRTILDLHPANRIVEAKQIIDKIIVGKQHTSPIPLVTKAGELLPVETKVVLGEWDGEFAMFAISRDISERIEAESKLRNSELRWEFALESTGDGIWDWDLNTGEVFFSDSWKYMLGLQPDEVEGSYNEWQKRIHPDEVDLVTKELNRYLDSRIPEFYVEHRMLCKNGDYKWILERGKAISMDEMGNPERMIVSQTDISTRKEYENSLMDALSKEKELNELKSQFVSMTSHEFRTPLASILMAADALRAYRDKMSEDEVNQRIDRIKSNVDFLKSVIEKMLNLSNIETGKISFKLEQFNVIESTKQVIDECSNLYEGKIRISLNYESEEDIIIISADKQMIKLVLSNIVINACKYSIQPNSVSVFIKENATSVIISIQDNGVGISFKDQKEIFKPFIRGSNVGNIRGTGLGLALSNEFIKRHGGEISVESEVNNGTVFTIRLPKHHNLILEG